MFDQMDELAQDYDERIRNARETTDMSQEDLANKLNEKASLIRKLERGDTLPSDDVQTKLENALEITLTAGRATPTRSGTAGRAAGVTRPVTWSSGRTERSERE